MAQQPAMASGERQIPVVQEVDVVAARLACGELADAAGFGIMDKYRLAISVSELATNILVHAGSGTIELRETIGPHGSRGIEIVARDQGGGIEDVELAMQDGYSTRGGLGCGLPGVERLMSEMQVSSAVGRGTTVRAVKWLQEPRTSRPGGAGFERRCDPTSRRDHEKREDL
jgi:serine/threonine-protein kinase RsbT